MDILLAWAVLSAAIWLTAVLLPGFQVKGMGGAILVAALFGLLNWGIGWILFFLIGLGTLGLGFVLAFLTRWLVTAILLKLVAAMLESLTIRSFGVAFLGALIMTGVGTLGEWVLHALMR